MEDIERSVAAYGSVQAANLEKGCSWITLFIAMAPSLGFLGTVIGMVMADISNPYYNSVFTACTNEAFARGYMTMLFNTLSRPDMEQAALTKLL